MTLNEGWFNFESTLCDCMIDFTHHFPDNSLRGTGNPISEKSPYL